MQCLTKYWKTAYIFFCGAPDVSASHTALGPNLPLLIFITVMRSRCNANLKPIVCQIKKSLHKHSAAWNFNKDLSFVIVLFPPKIFICLNKPSSISHRPNTCVLTFAPQLDIQVPLLQREPSKQAVSHAEQHLTTGHTLTETHPVLYERQPGRFLPLPICRRLPPLAAEAALRSFLRLHLLLTWMCRSYAWLNVSSSAWMKGDQRGLYARVNKGGGGSRKERGREESFHEEEEEQPAGALPPLVALWGSTGRKRTAEGWLVGTSHVQAGQQML